MLNFKKETREQLLSLARERGIYLEGNIIKLVDTEEDAAFDEYVKEAIKKDEQSRKKRLEITKQVQSQNKELTEWKKHNEQLNEDLKKALQDAEKSKETALSDLEVLQKKTQYELIGSIVKVSLWIICGIGVITTAMYALSLTLQLQNDILENTWSNMFGIMLTNCFSIIGTIMGVKYANGKTSGSSAKEIVVCKNCSKPVT